MVSKPLEKPLQSHKIGVKNHATICSKIPHKTPIKMYTENGGFFYTPQSPKISNFYFGKHFSFQF